MVELKYIPLCITLVYECINVKNSSSYNIFGFLVASFSYTKNENIRLYLGSASHSLRVYLLLLRFGWKWLLFIINDV